jgi:RNA recognition motif-containing protein
MPARKLSWWQKLLKAIGLYKEPVRPPRPERHTSQTEAKEPREPRRSKTRDARTEQSNSSENNDSSEGKKRRERSDKNTGRPRGGDPGTVENRRVYVGNLSYETTESDLEELFKGVGAVRRIEIVYNRSTHRSKGYGFVEMLDIDEAKRTVEVLHDQFFMGRQLTVSGAKSKDYVDAEQEEGGDSSTTATIPPLAPIHPVKEEVLDLIDESAPASSPEPTTEAVVEDSNSEVPTEEFTPQENNTVESPEEIKA